LFIYKETEQENVVATIRLMAVARKSEDPKAVEKLLAGSKLAPNKSKFAHILSCDHALLFLTELLERGKHYRHSLLFTKAWTHEHLITGYGEVRGRIGTQ